MNTDPRLPRADEAECYLLACLMDWPERAGEVLPLCQPSDFFETLHADLWRKFTTQLAMHGAIDRLAAGKELKCADRLLEFAYQAPTTEHAESRADMVKLAARGRQAHDVFQNAADAILDGRPADAVIAQVSLALESLETESIEA
jgi:replicative DNA helicase